MTVKEYAENRGVSKQSVYDRIRRGTLSVEIIDGVKHIIEGVCIKTDELKQVDSKKCKRIKKALKRSKQKTKVCKIKLKGIRKLIQAKDNEIDTLKKSLGLVQAVIDSKLLTVIDAEPIRKKHKRKG